MKFNLKILLLFVFLFPLVTISQQKINIIKYLKKIEAGKSGEVVPELNKLKLKYPNSPSVLFLNAVLTKDGNSALAQYENIYKNFPNSNYADASLYRIFTFYYSLGYYKKAENILNKLKSQYPKSPYINTADLDIQNQKSLEAFPTTVNLRSKIIPSAIFTIQAGAFLNIDNANRLKEKIIKTGYPSEVVNKNIGGSIFHIVTAGKFATQKETDFLLKRINQLFHLKGRVIRIRK